jgi:hypothetical protein
VKYNNPIGRAVSGAPKGYLMGADFRFNRQNTGKPAWELGF